jgi:pimeloyl-ACP methyl ester carboxylesterase
MRETEFAGFPALETQGNAAWPALLFVHGAFATHFPFAGWMRFFEQRDWRALAVARHGRCGLPPARAEGLTTAAYLDDLHRVLDALDTPPVLIGHSLGGLLAQRLAEQGRCTAAVLLAPAPPWILLPQLDALARLLPMLPAILSGRPIRPSYATAAHAVLNHVPEPDRRRIYDALVHESGIVYREMMFGMVRVDPRKVRCPIYVVGAEDDRLISPFLAREIAKYYRTQARLHPNHGHWFIEEPGWEAIAEDVAHWLERATPEAAG